MWKGFLFAIEIYSRMIFFSCTASIDVSDAIMSSLFFTVKHFWTELVTLNQQNKAIIPSRNFCQDPSKHFPCTKKFNTCFKIIIKNLVGGQLAWVPACGARGERKFLAWGEIVLFLDERTGFFLALVGPRILLLLLLYCFILLFVTMCIRINDTRLLKIMWYQRNR